MKFERLTVPAVPLPDLVAFNEKVHGWIDPWWRRRWVRLIAWAGAALFALVGAMWIYFAAGLPSSQSLLAYQPPLPTNVRGYDGDPVQTFARERRVDLSYDEYPPLLVHAFISAEDKTFFHHHGIDYAGFIEGGLQLRHPPWPWRARGGRVDDHPAGREISASGQQLQRRAQGARGDPRLPARGHAQQGADPRALPQLDLPRPQRLWSPGGGAGLFRQGRGRADVAGGSLSRDPSQGAVELRPGPRDAEGARPPQLCASGDVPQRLHHRGPVARRRRDAARNDPLRQQREVPPAGRLFHGRGPARADQAVRRGFRRTARTASTPAACGSALRWIPRCRIPRRTRFATGS